MERMVARVNEQDADVVVIAGDIFDNAWEAVEEPEQIAAVLRGIRSRYGVYAVTATTTSRSPSWRASPSEATGKSRAAPRWTPFSRPRTSVSCATRPCCSAARFIFTVAPMRSARGAAIEVRKTPAEFVEGLDADKPILVLTTSRASWRRWPRRAWTSISAGTRTTGRCSPGNLTVRLFWENACGCLPRGVDAQHRDLGRRSLRAEYARGDQAEICPITIHFMN